MIHRIVMNQRAVATASRCETLCEHPYHIVELGALEIPKRVSTANQRQQALFIPFARRNLGDDLLSNHVQRLCRNGQPVELLSTHAVQECRAFDEIVARQRE